MLTNQTNLQVSSPLAAQHSSTQSTPTKKKSEDLEHVTQKQIMKSERSRKEETKEGLRNFKNKFEDSTQSRVSLNIQFHLPSEIF